MPELFWEGKAEAVNASKNIPLRVLEFDSASSVGDADNLIVQGDNLQVMKALLPRYKNRVRCIYIDPPYNTGVVFEHYNDNFEHATWLNFMYPRLEMLREFLSDDGAIFISIDDNEQAHLKLICDEIFGATNFVAQITLVSNLSGRDYGGVARMHEYILIYRKTSALKLNLIEDESGKFKMFDERGGFELRELRNRNIRFNVDNRPNLYYPFYIETTTADENGLHKISLEQHIGWHELYPLESQGIKTVWRWGKDKSLANLNINIMAKPLKNNRWMIVEKYREERKMARSVWLEKEFRNEAGTLLLKEIFGEKVFDYPKSLNTLLRILEMTTDKDSIVLDAFAGSGTTAHAVINLNTQDGGNRRFIMIEEQEYCKTITAERVKRVGGEFKFARLGASLTETKLFSDADCD